MLGNANRDLGRWPKSHVAFVILNMIGCGLLPKGAAFRFKEQTMISGNGLAIQVKSSSAKRRAQEGRAFGNKCNNKNAR
jgi:hypothetical protein